MEYVFSISSAAYIVVFLSLFRWGRSVIWHLRDTHLQLNICQTGSVNQLVMFKVIFTSWNVKIVLCGEIVVLWVYSFDTILTERFKTL